MSDAPDDAIDRLYGLALEEFIPQRDALAKELRDAGRRGEATAVKSLKKPTVAAWAVNQAVRSQPRAARDLWAAGDALAAAQDGVLSGKASGADLREAAERERAALDPLVDAARGLLTSSGGDLSETTIDRVRATLRAAAIDADAREDVAAGRAVREREPRGLFGEEAAVARGSGRTARGRPADSAPRRSTTRDRSTAPGRSTTRGRSAQRDRSARGGTGTEEEATRGRSAGRGRSAPSPSRRPAARDREAEAARKREEAAARKREREEAAARERDRKAAAARVARAENALAAAEARSAKAAQQLEEARAREREAVEALAEARAQLRALEP